MASYTPAPSRAVHAKQAVPAFPRNHSCTSLRQSSRRSDPALRNVVQSALSSNQASQIVDSVIQQGTPHESLLKNGASAVWDFVEKASTDDPSSWLQSVSKAIADVPDVPLAFKQQLSELASNFPALSRPDATFTSTLESLPGSESLRGMSKELFASLSAGAADIWSALQGAAIASPLTTNATVFSTPLMQPSNFLPEAPLGGMLGGMSATQQVAVAAAVVAAMVVSSIGTGAGGDGIVTATDDELPTEYDQESIYRYWKTRPVTLAKRSLQTSKLAIGFLFGLALDKQTGQEKVNEKERARTLRMAIDELGPAYIKVAQALSTRVDILSPAYFEEITLLQDRVQPFDNEEAMSILEVELGCSRHDVFTEISSVPVAAASLGQVYRAKLRSNGAEVAIKVQRPGVLEMVALDLVLMRRGIEIASSLFPDLTRADDLLPVLDEWALKFFREMDYRKEAATMVTFKSDLAALEGIIVPDCYAELTTRRVIVTQWIEGEKLSESRAEDVRELCTTLLNAYLVQLLDTGLLHADPHPGNLIRTPDGKICILDYGLVTQVPDNLRVALLEYMAHLSMKDWTALGNDFVALEFVTEDSCNPNEVPGLMDSVGGLMEILMAGGGAVNLDAAKTRELVDMVGLDPNDLEDGGFMEGFATVLDNLSNPDSKDGPGLTAERAAKIRLLQEKVKFRLPPYFVLILRAFSVIEGIALKVDPGYSIINETFPYLSRRLLTDDNPEVRKALRQVLYGNGSRMDISRFRTLFSSVSSYTTDGLAAPAALPSSISTSPLPARSADSMPSTSAPALDKNTILALQSILSTSGSSYIQELLVGELAATLESVSRGAAVALLQSALQSALTSGTLRFLDRLGPMRSLLFPFPLPAEIISNLGSVVTLTEEDNIAISNVQTIWELIQPQLTSEIGSGNLRISLLRSFSSTIQELPNETRRDLLLGASRTSQQVLQQIVSRTTERVAKDVQSYRNQEGQVNRILGGSPSQPTTGLEPVLSALNKRA